MLNTEKYNSEEFILAPTKSLPITGVPIAGIREYARLPSREETERDLEIFINSCLNADKIYGCIIEAWWGEGKTDAYENFVKPKLQEKNIISFEIIATTVARIMEKRKEEKIGDPVNWMAFLAALFEAVWEERKLLDEKRRLEIEFFKRKEEEMKSDHEYVKRVIDQLTKKSSKVFFFIDELEQLERLPNREDILLGIRGLFDQTTYSGNLHLIMACTPDAYNRLVSSSTHIGGLVDRLKSIILPRPSKEEAVKFVYGLVDYLYEGKTPFIHPFINSGPAYAIVYAAHYTPRSIIKILQQVIEYSRIEANKAGKDGYLKRINGWEIIGALKKCTLTMFGVQVSALDGDLLEKLENTLKIENDKIRTDLLIELVELLIGEPIPHSLKELSNRLNVSNSKIKELIGIANNKSMEAELVKGELILQLTESSVSPESFNEDLRRFLMEFIFMDDSRTFKTRTFLPSKESSLRSISGEFDLSLLKYILSKISNISLEEDYYLISPLFIEHIYPNPEFLELDFIKDKNLRLELWKSAYEFINNEESLVMCEESLIDGLKRLKYLV